MSASDHSTTTPADPTLAADLQQACLLSGEFLLRSGLTSNVYFDKYRFEADPSLLKRVAVQLAPMVPEGIEVLAGLELGGVPIATALSLETGIPAAFVRKEAKTYGTAQLAEGSDIDGRRCLVVEDVITTGGQVALSIADLRARGAIVDSVLCTLLRGEPTAVEGAEVAITHLFTLADLEAASS